MTERNIFNDLDIWEDCASEGMFNAGMTALMRRHSSLRYAFVEWLSEQAGVRLEPSAFRTVRREMSVKARTQSGPCTALVDMALLGEGVQIWCEHKLTAALGRYDDGKLDQLTRYLDAAHRVMRGLTNKRQVEVPIPLVTNPQKPRVLLVLISMGDHDLSHLLEWRRRIESDDQGGFAWAGESGYLKWQDFYDRAKRALAELAGVEKAFADQFLEWWGNIPAMHEPDIPATWADMFPASKNGTFPPSPFTDLWKHEQQVARNAGLKISVKPYKGNDHSYKTIGGTDTIRQVQVRALQSWTRSPAGQPGMKSETLEVSFVGPGISEVEKNRGQIGERQWALATTQDGRIRESRVRIVVEVDRWTPDMTPDERSHALASAFDVALGVFESTTSMRLSETTTT